VGYGWWIDKHNRHHAHPNDVDRDPDVGPGAVAFTDSQARTRRGLGRWVCRWQAYLFFPMLLLEALNLHLASLRALRRQSGKSRWVEGSLLAGHVGGYLTALLLVLSPDRALVFLLVQQAVFGLTMGCSFAPNHKGMPLLSAADKVDYLRRQVLTSRNVRCGRVVDFALGGLNYQIEHHLFPSMPRANLKAAQPLVQAFCQRHDIVYRNGSLLDSYTQALRHLHAVGAPLRTTPGHPGDTRVEDLQPPPGE
jgi:fatty acid desaturase